MGLIWHVDHLWHSVTIYVKIKRDILFYHQTHHPYPPYHILSIYVSISKQKKVKKKSQPLSLSG